MLPEKMALVLSQPVVSVPAVVWLKLVSVPAPASEPIVPARPRVSSVVPAARFTCELPMKLVFATRSVKASDGGVEIGQAQYGVARDRDRCRRIDLAGLLQGDRRKAVSARVGTRRAAGDEQARAGNGRRADRVQVDVHRVDVGRARVGVR